MQQFQGNTQLSLMQHSPLPKRESYYKVFFGSDHFHVIDNLSELPQLQGDHPGETLTELKKINYNPDCFYDLESELLKLQSKLDTTIWSMTGMGQVSPDMDDRFIGLVYLVKDLEEKLKEIEIEIEDQHHCFN